MPSYRFCRPDDIPLLVEAINLCYKPHFPEESLMTLAQFKKDIRELNLWSSSCMIATEGKTLIGVCLGCKRKTETLIYKIGVHPDFQSHGHGRHLLTSLCEKLAVLGPPRIVAEVPKALTPATKLFEYQGYTPCQTYFDFAMTKEFPPLQNTTLVSSLTTMELVSHEAFYNSKNLSWGRTSETLINKKNNLLSIAILSVDRIEAYVMYEHDSESKNVSILRFYSAHGETGLGAFELLIRHLAHTKKKPLFASKVSSEEIDFDVLEHIGFEKGREYLSYELCAKHA